MISDCKHCDGVQNHQKHNVCPRCESAEFDGQGSFDVGGTRMYRLTCWNCCLTFAVEVDPDA